MHTRTRRLIGKTEWLTDQSETTASIQFATHVQVQSTIVHSHLIKYNVLILSHTFSSSQVSLYGPSLNQLCQDDLPLTSNTPLYQSQVPFSGVHLLNHARMTYSVQLNVLYATQLSTISPRKDLRCPQCVQSTLQSFLGRLQHYLQVPMSFHELGNLSIKSNIPELHAYHDASFYG